MKIQLLFLLLIISLSTHAQITADGVTLERHVDIPTLERWNEEKWY